MQRRRFFALGCLLLALGLGGCGFKLRGYVDVPAELQTLQFSAQDIHSELAQNITRALQSAGVTLADQAPYRLRLLEERYERQAATYSGSAKVEEYELTGHARFVLEDAKGTPLLGPDSVSALRFYQYDPDNPVGKSEEETLLRQELRRDLARQIIQRFQALTPEALQAARQRAATTTAQSADQDR